MAKKQIHLENIHTSRPYKTWCKRKVSPSMDVVGAMLGLLIPKDFYDYKEEICNVCAKNYRAFWKI